MSNKYEVKSLLDSLNVSLDGICDVQDLILTNEEDDNANQLNEVYAQLKKDTEKTISAKDFVKKIIPLNNEVKPK